MQSIRNFLANEPVRVYEILVALMALVVLAVPDFPVALVLAFLVPVLGLGEVVRSKVTPYGHVVDDEQ